MELATLFNKNCTHEVYGYKNIESSITLYIAFDGYYRNNDDILFPKYVMYIGIEIICVHARYFSKSSYLIYLYINIAHMTKSILKNLVYFKGCGPAIGYANTNSNNLQYIILNSSSYKTMKLGQYLVSVDLQCKRPSFNKPLSSYISHITLSPSYIKDMKYIVNQYNLLKKLTNIKIE
jgi:hypothetical protein